MPVRVAVRKLSKGPYLKLFFSVIRCHFDYDDDSICKEFNVDDLAMVRFKFERGWETPGALYYLECSFSVKKHELAKKSNTVKMNIACDCLEYSRQLVCTEDWTEWIRMGRCYKSMSIKGIFYYGLEVTMTVSNVNSITFPQLYEETEFCDCHLSTADGSGRVAVHKVCLIAHSDRFKSMLFSQRKQTREASIRINDVTVQTLQHLKDYIYLGTLPDDGLRPLLLIATGCSMESLKEECVMKLAVTVKPENLYSLQEFAAKYKLCELISAIVELTPDTTVQKAYELKRKQQNESENDGNSLKKIKV